jgi:putative nucleotidyltransferase with HDIG domain
MDRDRSLTAMIWLKWALLGGAFFLALLHRATTPALEPAPLPLAGLALGILLYLVAFTLVYPRWSGDASGLWFAATALEMLLLTGLMLLSGGAVSPVFFPLLVVVGTSGLRHSPWAGVAAACAALLVFLILCLAGGGVSLSSLLARSLSLVLVGFLGLLSPSASGRRDEALIEEQARLLEEAYRTAREQAGAREKREAELYDKQRKLTALMQISRHLMSVRRIDELLSKLVAIARQEMNSAVGMVMLHQAGELAVVAAHGLSDLSLRALKTRPGQGLFGQLLVDGLSVRAAGDDERLAALSGHEKFRSLLAVPLQTPQDKLPFGVLAVANVLVGKEYSAEAEDYLKVLAVEAAIAIKNISLYNELERSYYELVQALAQAIEAKDPYTHGHVGRVRTYSVKLARAMSLPQEEVELIAQAAVLHDVGKISTPDHILMKPGALTEEEFEIMKAHVENALHILKDIRSLPPRVIDMVLHHHERYDGKGYPHGLQGDEIPLGAQILAVADTFDAMTSDRPYRKGFTPEEALRLMEKGLGTQFNPRVLQAFFTLFPEYRPQTAALEASN